MKTSREHRVVKTAALQSPLGELIAALTERGLCALAFADRWDVERPRLERRLAPVRWSRGRGMSDVERCLKAYWDGNLAALAVIVVDPGGTEFQRRVWFALRNIPAGQTSSYRDLAATVGRPGAARAVASANATNPVAIVVPCHRVIHADGSLSGYGGGVERKRRLLRHEGAVWAEAASLWGD